MTENNSPADEPKSAYAILVLATLVVVYTFNFIDRQIVGILAVPIKAELGLSDKQLSLMGGFAFAIFYSLLGVPIALLADRWSRVRVMTIALVLWSAMTAVSGLARNFWHLFLARLGVGVGEAGGVAPAYSLIADYFPPRQRARALAAYSFGVPVGSALGIILGGVLTTVLGWREAFFIVGAAGLVVAPLFFAVVREPQRGRFDGKGAGEAAPLSAVVETLLKKPSFWGLSFGAAFSSMAGYGLLFWMPSFFVRSFGGSLAGFFSFLPGFLLPPNPGPQLYASYFFGAILLIGGVAGLWLGGVIADRRGAAAKSAYATTPAFAFLCALPFFLFGVLSTSPLAVFCAFLVVQALNLVWLGPVLAAFQHIVPPSMRTTASAVFLFINNLIGIGLGNFVIGALSDALKAEFGAEALRYAIVSASVFYAAAAGLLLLAARRLEKDWEY